MPPLLPSGDYSDSYTELPGFGIHAVVPNAIVVLRGEGWTEESAAALRGVLSEDVLIVALSGGDGLEVLDEDEMRAAGWVRVEK